MGRSVNPAPLARRFPKREARAERTRRAVTDAAAELFVDLGYGATTIQAIADEAGVAVQTVYATFGNKRSVLAEALDVAIAGDDEEVVVNDRAWMRPVFEAPTGAERLHAYAAAVRAINERAGDLFEVVEVAAAVDPEVVELAEATRARRRRGAASVIGAVREVAPLRPGLTERRAVDVLWLLNGAAPFRQLVRWAGWRAEEYEAWLAAAMVRELLGEESGASGLRTAQPSAGGRTRGGRRTPSR